MTQKDSLGGDQNKEEKKKGYGDPKTLILKWGKHKHRIPIHLDPPAPPEPEPKPVPPPRPSTDASSAFPWNLRDRNRIFRPKKLVLELTAPTPYTETKEPMIKLEVSLSKSEIMKDFLKMTGKMPPSKPKKRARAIQQNIDDISCGNDLTEISSDRYHVPEQLFPATNKMRRRI